MVHNIIQVAVPIVSPVEYVRLLVNNIKVEFDVGDSYLRLEDKLSKSFEVYKRLPLLEDLGVWKNEGSK